MIVIAEQASQLLRGLSYNGVVADLWQLCVKREMNSELDVGWDTDHETGEVIELNER